MKGVPAKAKTMAEIAFAAYTNHPQGMEAGLEAVDYYDPPNLTFPFGSYICVVDIDRGTGEVKVRRFVAVDDCGTIINPMIVEGQIHGGLTMRLFPRPLPYLVYYGHAKREPIEEVYLVRLYGSGQDQPEFDMSEWPW